MITIITHTPIWVWIVLALLVYLGILQSKTRLIQRWRLFIVPVIFLPLSLITLSTSANISLSVMTLVLAMAVSFGVAKYYFDKHPIIYQTKQGQWWQRGSWLPLIVYLMIFMCRYAISASQAMRLPYIDGDGFATFMGVSLGLGLGVLFAIGINLKIKR